MDADAWLHRFSYYVDYKRLNDEQQIKLFKLLMSDAAADWMRTLPREAMASFKELSQRFSDRFIANAASKNANVAALWGRRQGTHESAEEFVTGMQRIAARIPVNDMDLVRHAIVHGLKDEIRRFVLMSRCTSIEEVMEAARLAEATADDVPATADRAMLKQLATQVSAIQEAVEKMTIAPVAPAPSNVNAIRIRRRLETRLPAHRQVETPRRTTEVVVAMVALVAGLHVTLGTASSEDNRSGRRTDLR